VFFKAFGGKNGTYIGQILLLKNWETYETGAESFNQTVVQPDEIGVSSGHYPIKWKSFDRVNSERLLKESTLDDLRLGNCESELVTINQNCLFEQWAALPNLVIFLLGLSFA
jgi:hypothetical protein